MNSKKEKEKRLFLEYQEKKRRIESEKVRESTGEKGKFISLGCLLWIIIPTLLTILWSGQADEIGPWVAIPLIPIGFILLFFFYDLSYLICFSYWTYSCYQGNPSSHDSWVGLLVPPICTYLVRKFIWPDGPKHLLDLFIKSK